MILDLSPRILFIYVYLLTLLLDQIIRCKFDKLIKKRSWKKLAEGYQSLIWGFIPESSWKNGQQPLENSEYTISGHRIEHVTS
jgi:hypothetical protein